MQGEYVLLEPIGDAGGSVYRAHHMPTGRLVAVRLLRGDIDGVVAERALETARIASRVRHPALAAVEACGRQPDGSLFIVSEYVDGDPLDHWADKTGIPPLATVVELVHRLCVGLNAAHRNGLTHDALYPRNVRVKANAAPPASRIDARLLDLGVPAFMHAWPPRIHAAQFMAPEQLARALRAAGGGPVTADARMNVYSCGCILYYLCTGGAPYQDRNLHDLSLSHVAGKLVLPSKINPQIPPALDAIIARAVALAPAERYPNVSDLALALARLQLSRTSSGVRPVVIAPAATAFGGIEPALRGGSMSVSGTEPALRGGSVPVPGGAPEQDKRATWGKSFDERPTSESRLPALLSLSERRSSAPPSERRSSAPPAQAAERSAPAGSFSSAPPPAESPTLPPPPLPGTVPPPLPASAVGPRAPRLPPRAPRLESHAPRLEPQPISALLDPPASALSRAEPEEIVPAAAAHGDELATSSSGIAPALRGGAMPVYTPAKPLKRRRARSVVRSSWAFGLAVALGAAFWLLGHPPLPPEQVRTTPLPSGERVAAPGTAAMAPVRAARPAPGERPGESAHEATAAANEAARVETPALAGDELHAFEARPALRAGRARAVGGIRGSVRATAASARGGALAAEPQLSIQSVAEAAGAEPAADAAGAAEVPSRADPPAIEADAPAAEPALLEGTQPSLPPSAPSSARADATEGRARVAAANAADDSRRSVADGARPGRALQASARIDDLTVRGSLTTSEVRRAIERIRPQLAACYARAARTADRNGYGTLRVEVEIDERGRAHAPRAAGAALPGLDACVAQAAGKIVSARPPDTGTVKTSWKVAFAP